MVALCVAQSTPLAGTCERIVRPGGGPCRIWLIYWTINLLLDMDWTLNKTENNLSDFFNLLCLYLENGWPDSLQIWWVSQGIIIGYVGEGICAKRGYV